MFEFLTSHSDTDAIVILKNDHTKVKDLFDKFEKTENLRDKKKIVANAIMELKIHAAIEEEIFYPTVRRPIGKKIMNEADEEHHVVKVLIAELEEMDGTEDHYDAKFKVLSENVRHHIKEEERDMLPKARDLDIDFEVLGNKMLSRKQQLLKTGVATFGEEKMVAASKGKNDSPAEAAKNTKASSALVTEKSKNTAKASLQKTKPPTKNAKLSSKMTNTKTSNNKVSSKSSVKAKNVSAKNTKTKSSAKASQKGASPKIRIAK